MPTSGDIAKVLGKSATTIKDWVDKHPDYFSDPARGIGVRNRYFNEDDGITLATINLLVNEGLSHEAITKRLAEGFRVDEIDTRLIPVAAAEQFIDATVIKQELEIVKAERDRLAEAITSLEDKLSARDGEIKSLLRELGDVRERAARAEAQAEMLKDILKGSE